ncbi:MAG: hypothetical protein M1830_008790 [Pleopsidium flavum]|nr:MAG: hypothetical protein M1830_008790 [Pleopsidium flavum]
MGVRTRKTMEQMSLGEQRPRSGDRLPGQSKSQHSNQARTRDSFSGTRTVTSNGSARSDLQTPQTMTLSLQNGEPVFLDISTDFDLTTDIGNMLEPRSQLLSSESLATDLLLHTAMSDATTDFPIPKPADSLPTKIDLGDMEPKPRTMSDFPDKSTHDLAFSSEKSPLDSACLDGNLGLAQNDFSLPLFADTDDGQHEEHSVTHISSRSSESTRSRSVSLSVGDGRTSVSRCLCVAREANILSKLSGLTDWSPSIRIDEGLTLLNQAIIACQTFLDCQLCRKDAGRILLVLMVLRLALDLLGQITSHVKSKGFSAGDIGRVGDQADVALKFGMYEICEQEEKLIIKMLIRRTMLKCAGTLQSVQSLCERPSSKNMDSGSAGNFSGIGLQCGAHEYPILGMARTDCEYFATTIRQMQAVLPSLDPEQGNGV